MMICTGTPFHKGEIELFKELQIQDRLICLTATDAELSQFYSNAALFVFPSLYEGFGMPILEAHANSCPVVLSNASCFPEIPGNSAEYFDPYSVNSITASMQNILENPAYRTELIHLGNKRLSLYSWKQTIEQTERKYKKVIGAI
jgi:glycosyltransferase involved in cell wall biosynthesis